MTSRSTFLSSAKLRRFRVLRRKAYLCLPWRNSQGPRSGRFRILSFGVSYIRGVEASQKRNGDTSKGIGLQVPPRRRRMAAGAADWQTPGFRDRRIQFGAAGHNDFLVTLNKGGRAHDAPNERVDGEAAYVRVVFVQQ